MQVKKKNENSNKQDYLIKLMQVNKRVTTN